MAWRLHDLIHLRIVDERLEIAQGNPLLDTLDKVLDVDEHIDWITFSPQYSEVFDVFNKIVRKNSKYITTAKQVIEFVDYCIENFSDKADLNFDLDRMNDLTHAVHLPDDLIIVIELED